jgi:hypothetical protein
MITTATITNATTLNALLYSLSIPDEKAITSISCNWAKFSLKRDIYIFIYIHSLQLLKKKMTSRLERETAVLVCLHI